MISGLSVLTAGGELQIVFINAFEANKAKAGKSPASSLALPTRAAVKELANKRVNELSSTAISCNLQGG